MMISILIVGLVSTLMSVGFALSDADFSEAAAWGCLAVGLALNIAGELRDIIRARKAPEGEARDEAKPSGETDPSTP